MNHRKHILACGVITSALILWIIPCFFMRGVSDAVWGGLMLLLPCAAVIGLAKVFGGYPPKAVFGALLVECVISMVFYKPIASFLGYRIRSLSQDLFEFAAYIIFAVGWSAAATFAQFITLLVLEKYRHKG